MGGRGKISVEPWDDDTVMPWGKWKGRRMEDVPGDYLHWLIEQSWVAKWPGLHAYLKKNADTIYEQAQDLEDERGDKGGYESYEDYRRDVRD